MNWQSRRTDNPANGTAVASLSSSGSPEDVKESRGGTLMADDLKDTLKKAGNRASEKATEAKNWVEEKAEEAGDWAKQKKNQAQNRAEEAQQKAKNKADEAKGDNCGC
jgi:glutamyl-tRNA reductase